MIQEEEVATNILILNEVMGEVLGEISETYGLIMDEMDRIQKKKYKKIQKKIRKTEQIYVKKVKETKTKMRKEELEMKQNIEELLGKFIETNEELFELNRKEKENRAVIEMIFDIVKNWTDIDFWFSQLLGMREALKTIEEDSNQNQYNKETITHKIRSDMMRKTNLIKKLHDINKQKVIKVLSSINNTLDFVEFGLEDVNRSGIVMALTSMENVAFWTLVNEETIEIGIDNIEESVSETRDLLFQLPLYKLRPRRSIRQILWDEIDSFEREILFSPEIKISVRGE